MMSQSNKDSLIACAITLIALAMIVIGLMCGHLSFDVRNIAIEETPEIGLLSDEEQLIEPELIRELGEENASKHSSPAPAIMGNPDPDERENYKQITPGNNPKPAPPVKEKVSTKKEEKVKTDKPSVSNEEKQKVKSSVANKFPNDNGVQGGKSGSTGSGGTGTGIKGVASGRTFKGCPKPQVSLRHKTTVIVDVIINANGKVTSAKARSGPPADIRRACEAAARGASWSPKADSPSSKGSITFTITPK